jgi:RND family efflux transporter MFP subunit
LALARAVSEHETAEALVGELDVQKDALAKEHAAHGRRVAGLRRQLELRTEERRRRDEAKAAVELAESRAAQARIAIETAKLSLSRMTVRAPAAGKVLSVVARPGGKVMGLSPASGHDAATIITMYDPDQLQVRADVRLEEVPRVVPGQPVRIETPAVKGALSGRVIAATSLADIQKNTLQVKVAIDDPPAVLKPDMLVQVSFLSLASTTKTADAGSAVALTIPSHLIRNDGDSPSVWLADQVRGVARLRMIDLGSVNASGWREVKRGLSAGDRVIASGAEGLTDGERIRIVGEAPEESRAAPTAKHDHSANQ